MRDDPEFNPYNNLHLSNTMGANSTLEMESCLVLEMFGAQLLQPMKYGLICKMFLSPGLIIRYHGPESDICLVGEIFRAELAAECSYLFSNPRDDGHPDLCVISERTTNFLLQMVLPHQIFEPTYLKKSGRHMVANQIGFQVLKSKPPSLEALQRM